VRREFAVDADAEITVECAPGQLADATLDALVAAGVNRVSLGVQSFIDREAALSGRLHSRAVVLADIMRLRAAQICNLNVDLIAGLPAQSLASWQESLSVMTSLTDAGVPHVRVYMLEVDDDSRLGREMLAQGARYHADIVPTDDTIARMYATAIETLGEAGVEQYEISNFCRSGLSSRHNLRYWQRRPYLGIGLDASSMLLEPQEPPSFFGCLGFRRLSKQRVGRVLRSTTSDDLKAYLAGSEPVESTWLTAAQQHEEAWFLGLRLNAGVEVASVKREFGAAMVAPALKVVERLAEQGLVEFDGRRVRLTAQGRLLSNDVFQEFLELESELAN
jgi:oxygen-independent coproporphyrinogen-3 oxidase